MRVGLSLVLALFISLSTSLDVVSASDLVVYDEIPLNYPWTGFMGNSNGASLTGQEGLDTVYPNNPENGNYCAKIPYNRALEDWAGVYIQATGDWRRGSGIGKDLTGAKKLVFYARGEQGGENIKFGYGYDQPDQMGFTDSAYASRMETLTNYWQEYQFDLSGKDLSHINGLFMFSVDKYNNPMGVIFYLDNVTYIYQD